MSEQELIKVNYYIKMMERAICATFAYGEDSNDNPYFSLYFIVNNSGIVVVYDKSLPIGIPDESDIIQVRDELRSMTIQLKEGSQKQEVLQYINAELIRVGDKLRKEGRALEDMDIEKMITKVSRKYEDERQAI